MRRPRLSGGCRWSRRAGFGFHVWPIPHGERSDIAGRIFLFRWELWATWYR